jgi:hypothetical protein
MHPCRWVVYLPGFPEVVLAIVKVLSADHILLEDSFERFAHDGLAEVVTCAEDLQNQDQDGFHVGVHLVMSTGRATGTL